MPQQNNCKAHICGEINYLVVFVYIKRAVHMHVCGLSRPYMSHIWDVLRASPNSHSSLPLCQSMCMCVCEMEGLNAPETYVLCICELFIDKIRGEMSFDIFE